MINAIQGASLERHLFSESTWNGATVGFLIAYTCAMLFLYTLAPILFRLSSSPFYNISILTSDFWGLLFGLGLFGYKPYWLYFIAFALIIVGLLIYFVHPQEVQDVNVVTRGKQAVKDAQNGRKFVLGEIRTED